MVRGRKRLKQVPVERLCNVGAVQERGLREGIGKAGGFDGVQVIKRWIKLTTEGLNCVSRSKK